MSDEYLISDYSTPVDFSDPKTQASINKTVGETDMTPPVGVVPSISPTYDQALIRSGKYHLGLGETSPGRDVLRDSIINKDEEKFRQQAVQNDYVKEEGIRSNFIRKFLVDNPQATRDQLDLLRQVPITKLKDTNYIFEELYAKKVVNETTDRFIQSGVITDAYNENKDKSSDILNFAQQNITNYEYARKKYEEIDNLIKSQSYLEAAADIGADFIPFLKNYRMTNLLKGAVSPFLPGNNRQDQYTQYYLGSPEESSKLLDKAVDYLKEKNLHQAREYLHGLLMYSSSDQIMSNVGMALDVATLPVASAVNRLANATRSVTRAATLNDTRFSSVLDAMGDTNRASLASVIENLDAKAVNTTNRLDSWESLKSQSMPIFNPRGLSSSGSSVLSREQVVRLTDDLENNATSLLKKVVDETVPVGRILDNPEVLNTAVDETRRLWRIQYPHMDNAILNVRPAYGEGKLANVENVAIEVGTQLGDLYVFPTAAEIAAKDWYRFKSYTIKQRGDGYYIEVLKPIDERSLAVYNQLAVETNNRTPTGLINTFLGYLRSNEDTISRSVLSEAKIAQYGSSQLTNVIREAAKDIGRLRNRDDFETFLRRQQVQPNPNNPNVTGYRSKSVNDFERDWNAQFNRLPDEREIKAYFTYTQLHSLDYMMRNLTIYNAKNRLGLEMFDFPINGVKYKVGTIEGKLVDDIHIDRLENANVLVWDSNPSNITVISTRDNRFNRDLVNQWRADGYKFVQLSHYGEEHLRRLPRVGQLPDVSINYVVSREASSSPIPLVQIPNRDGWHVSYPDEGFYIRQPNVHVSTGRSPMTTYYGDNNLHYFANEQEAQQYVVRMNNAREILITGDHDVLRRYLADNLPYNLADFIRQFRQFDRGGILDINTPFYVTRSNVNVQQAHKISDLVHNGNLVYPNFTDKRESVYNLYRNDVNLNYAVERDGPINTIVNLGSEHAPVFQFRPAQTLDPVETINRSTSQLMRGRYLEDLKIKASQEFVAEFHTLFDTTLEEMTKNPFYYLTTAEMKTTGVDRDLLAAAKNTRRSLINFLGLQSDFEKNLSFVRQRLSNDILPRVIGRDGTERVVNATQIVDGWALGAITDPGQFFRNVAFHLKMGMFNPTQIFKQANTFTHILGIAGPTDAVKAMSAATMTRALEFTKNEGIIRNTATRLIEFGWSREQFLESYRAMHRTGFNIVGREHSYLGDFMNPSVIDNAGTKALNAGTVFFREGESLVRHAAWNASYLEWRRANPTRTFNDQAIKEVLNRADIMNVNMSHASNAPWQYGLTSVSGQFFGYATRLTEQMLGYGPNRRLTDYEKLRLVGAYSLMYGVPLGVLGTTLGAFGPVHETYFSELRKRGIDTDNNTILKVVNEGIPGVALSWALGKDFNVKESWGPNGNPFIRDFVENDKGFWGAVDLLGGAGVKTTRQTASAIANLIGVSGRKLLGVATDEMPLTPQDFIDVMNNATSFNQARKALAAINFAEYVTKNEGTVVKDMTATQGVIMGLLGVEPSDLSKMHGLIGDIKKQKKDWTAAEKEAEKYISLWLKEDKEDLKDQYLRRAKTALVAGGVPQDEQLKWLHQSLRSKSQDVVRKLELDFAKGNPTRLKALLDKGQN